MTENPFDLANAKNLPTAEGLLQFQKAHEARLEAIVERGKQARAALAATEIEVSSRDGAVTVVVGAGGVLKDLRFGAKASGTPPTQLRAAIMSTYQQACAQAAERSTAAIARIGGGADNPAYQMLRDAIPSFQEKDLS